MKAVFVSDLHCGVKSGLTPSQYENGVQDKYQPMRRKIWDWYVRQVFEIGAVDVLFCVGDLIDGPCSRVNNGEHLTTSVSDQVSMAVDCLRGWQAARKIVVPGTKYHVGDDELAEQMIASKIGAEYDEGGHWRGQIGGYTFDVRHHIGGVSSGSLERQLSDMRDWFFEDQQRFAVPDLLVRAHVHVFRMQTVLMGSKAVQAMTLPALQGLGSRFGQQRVGRKVEVGLVVFEDGRVQPRKMLVGEYHG